MNLQREKPWDADKKKIVLDRLNKWTQNTTWYMNEVKDGVQVFTSESGVDLSISKIITEEYQRKIKENKMEPVATPANIIPPWSVIAVGAACYEFIASIDADTPI